MSPTPNAHQTSVCRQLKMYSGILFLSVLTAFASAQDAGSSVDQQLAELKAQLQSVKLQLVEQETEIRSLKLQRSLAVRNSPLDALPRTCFDIFSANKSSPSGIYTIDPDGSSSRGPISVHCDMTRGGTTVVHHDSENNMTVTRCPDAGCHKRSVNYTADLSQVIALTRVSEKCSQAIQFTCLAVPLTFNDINYGWWDNSGGQPRYYWAGLYNSTHTCQCGIDNKCIDTETTCNCDAMNPVEYSDRGEITEKVDLPVTRLNFGRIRSSASSAKHSLGPLECSGREKTSDKPENCDDLWLLGHTSNGYYAVSTGSGLKSIFCDFADSRKSKDIGQFSLAESVHFFVKHADATSVGSIKNFVEITGHSAMNATSGVFTAPNNGIYLFNFHSETDSSVVSKVALFSNANEITSSASGTAPPLSLSAILQLKTGNTVHLNVQSGNVRNAFFSGTLLEAETTL